MKTAKLLMVTGAILMMSFNNPTPGSLTDAERKAAADSLKETKDNLLKAVKGLSAAQLNFKADATSWSVAECVEHLAISENNLFGFVQMGLKEAADPSRRSEVKMSDDAVVMSITDRSGKVKTSERFEPTNKFGSYEGTVKEFTTKRDASINYVKTTADDLRNHYNDFPFGKLDTYQTIMFMSGHTTRHTAQIQEVKANANFPKK